MLLVNQHIGFGAGGGRLTSLALQGSATLSTAASITAPSDINAGDLLILVDRADGAGASVVPSGFSSVTAFQSSVAEAGYRLNVSFKVATGAEESTSIGGMDGSASDSKIMACFRGAAPISAAMAGGVLTQDSADNPAGLTILAGAATAPLLVVGVYSSHAPGTVDPRAFSTTKDAEVGSADSTLYLAWKFYASSPANTTIDMDDEGDINILIGAYITLSA